ncbi:MAG: DOMON-like domain-containing protein [Steroidobacteraceae bacterium]
MAHPTTQSDAIKSLDVQLSVLSPGVLTLGYALRADMSRIRVGAEGVPGPADHLWKHTCFEMFIQPRGSRGYYEFNFSPTKQWALYRFDSYRQGMTPMDAANPPEISIRKTSDTLELLATFPLPISAGMDAAQRPRLALTAVVEEDSGRLCYWSARHPQGKPDFHHPDGFIFDL